MISGGMSRLSEPYGFEVDALDFKWGDGGVGAE